VVKLEVDLTDFETKKTIRHVFKKIVILRFTDLAKDFE
jgi:hypothetical protein